MAQNVCVFLVIISLSRPTFATSPGSSHQLLASSLLQVATAVGGFPHYVFRVVVSNQELDFCIGYRFSDLGQPMGFTLHYFLYSLFNPFFTIRFLPWGGQRSRIADFIASLKQVA